MGVTEMKKPGQGTNRGEITVETTIVLVTILFVLMVILSFGFLIYEKHNLTVTANAVAEKVAQTYPHPDCDISTGRYTADPNADPGLYRYLFSSQADSLLAENQARASAYGLSRLGTLSLASEVTPPTCTLKLISDGLGRSHVEVTMTSTYQVVGGAFFQLFGLPSSLQYTATGYAECLDLMDYVTVTDFSGAATSLNWLGSKFIQAADTWWSVVEKLTK